MPLTFIQPKALTNDDGSSLSYVYSFDNPSSPKCLKHASTPCTPLEGYKTYITTNSGAANHGCYVPVVGGQADLNNNYAQLNYESASPLYLFFKPFSSSTSILHATNDLATGYANGTVVPTNGVPGDEITNANFGEITLLATNSDGNVIIVGILDDGVDD